MDEPALMLRSVSVFYEILVAFSGCLQFFSAKYVFSLSQRWLLSARLSS